MSESAPARGGPVVGFDLDLTLVDSAAGIGRTLRAALAAEGVPEQPSDEVLHPLIGMPLEATIATVAPGADARGIAERYRRLYPALGVPGTRLLPGAQEAFAAVHARQGRVLVVSAKVESAVLAVLGYVGLGNVPLAPDLVVGGLFGRAKGLRLRAAGAHVYVGDHPGDMEAARVAGAVGVAVTTGGAGEAALRAAGADAVLPGLSAFPSWFDAWFDAWSDARSDAWSDARFDGWFDARFENRFDGGPAARRDGSATAGPRLDDQPGEREGEADRAQECQRGQDPRG
ncbi:MAG: HAD family hydrolase [Kineosporiaceae bacterium]